MGKTGSIEDIIEKVIAKRSEDYELLIFEESKEIGKEADCVNTPFGSLPILEGKQSDILSFINLLTHSLNRKESW